MRPPNMGGTNGKDPQKLIQVSLYNLMKTSDDYDIPHCTTQKKNLNKLSTMSANAT